MDKSKKKILLITSLIIVALIGIFIGLNNNNNESAEQRTGKSSQAESDVVTDDKSSGEENDSDENESGMTSGNESAINDSSTENMPSGREWESRLSSLTKSPDSSQSESTVSTESSISLPYSIPGTSLVVRNMDDYDGIFLEDGSDSEITNIAAILVENTGDQDIEYVTVYVRTDKETLEFTGSAIPAHSKIIMMEQNKKAIPDGPIVSISATATDGTTMSLSESQIEIVSEEDGKITLKNISAKEIPLVRVFYKFYLPEEDTYVGGITYTSSIEDLKPGQEAGITPSHFSEDGSKIVMIRTFESKN